MMGKYFYKAAYRIGFFAVSGLFVVVLASCSVYSSDKTVSREELDELETQIIEMIGDAPAESVEYCRVIGFGHKSCGGYRTYFAYSTSHSNEEELKALVDRFYEMEKRYHRQNNIDSTCEFIAKPNVEIVNGYCQRDWGHN